jgi:hypothetical protein
MSDLEKKLNRLISQIQLTADRLSSLEERISSLEENLSKPLNYMLVILGFGVPMLVRGLEELRIAVREVESLAGGLKANRAYKAEVDLGVARSDQSLMAEWGIVGKGPYLSLTVLRVGTGAFKLRTYFTPEEYAEYDSSELCDGYIVDMQFIDLRLTNIVQSVVNPVFIVDWRE